MLISSRNTLKDTGRNNVLPAILASLSPLSRHKTSHHIPSSQNEGSRTFRFEFKFHALHSLQCIKDFYLQKLLESNRFLTRKGSGRHIIKLIACGLSGLERKRSLFSVSPILKLCICLSHSNNIFTFFQLFLIFKVSFSLFPTSSHF